MEVFSRQVVAQLVDIRIFKLAFIILDKALGLSVLAFVVDKHHLTDAEHPPLLCHGDDHLEPESSQDLNTALDTLES